ncbi:MAG TPA: DUF1801 domain-containing protein [Planctomycetaceae bacterium]|nr:DUF1801 domain-containing protein [Planctomycetaceae bacterium]
MLTSLPADWREEMLAEIRRLIVLADPEMVEERKWMKPTNPAGVPVWSHGGIVCTGETYKQVVKVTFMRGASLADPHGLFNSSLEGNARRAIDLREGETLNPTAFKALIKAAVAENLRSADSKGKPSPKTKAGGAAAKPVKLLSGGNPQIAKGDGDAPVQAYIAAMPGWKSDLGKRLDALIVRAVPKVRKAVKWNSPLYGVEEGVWFLGIHCFAKYIKVAFFRGAALRPIPPGESKQKDVRYLNLREDDVLDEVQFLAWVKQASQIPGERM